MNKLIIAAIAITSILNINIGTAKANQLTEINTYTSQSARAKTRYKSQSLTHRQEILAKAIAQINDSYEAQYQVSISPSTKNVLEMAKIIGATERELKFVAQQMETSYQSRGSGN